MSLRTNYISFHSIKSLQTVFLISIRNKNIIIYIYIYIYNVFLLHFLYIVQYKERTLSSLLLEKINIEHAILMQIITSAKYLYGTIHSVWPIYKLAIRYQRARITLQGTAYV